MSPAFLRTFALAVVALLAVGVLTLAALLTGLSAAIDSHAWASLRAAMVSEAVPAAALVLLTVLPLAYWIAAVRQRRRAALETVRHDLDVMLHANPAHRLDPATVPPLADLCHGINALAERACGPIEAPMEPVLVVPELPPARPEFFGFDLFARGVAADLECRSLADLPYTVFDTETTGLDPTGGDEIVAIGAVRVAKGRIVRDYAFDCLVDPRRPIPALATRIHGIDAQQVAGCPGIESALPALRRFAADSVLVGHNVAFDLRFFELKAAVSGTLFDLPVVDTLILASLVDRREDADHTLEGLARRYGIATAQRHHALSDAATTAEVFLRLLPLLARRGIVTLGQALTASRQSPYARVKY